MYSYNCYQDYKSSYNKLKNRDILLTRRKNSYIYERNTGIAVKYFTKGLEIMTRYMVTYGVGVTSGPIGAYLALAISKNVIGIGFDIIDFGLDQQISHLNDIIHQINEYEEYQSLVPPLYRSSLLEVLAQPVSTTKNKDSKWPTEGGTWRGNIDDSPKYDNVNYDKSDYENIA